MSGRAECVRDDIITGLTSVSTEVSKSESDNLGTDRSGRGPRKGRGRSSGRGRGSPSHYHDNHSSNNRTAHVSNDRSDRWDRGGRSGRHGRSQGRGRRREGRSDQESVNGRSSSANGTVTTLLTGVDSILGTSSVLQTKEGVSLDVQSGFLAAEPSSCSSRPEADGGLQPSNANLNNVPEAKNTSSMTYNSESDISLGGVHGDSQESVHVECQDDRRDERQDKGRAERLPKGRGERHDKSRGERHDRGRGERQSRGRGERQNRGRGERQNRGRGERQNRRRSESQGKVQGHSDDKVHVENQDKVHDEHQDKAHGVGQDTVHAELPDKEQNKYQHTKHDKHQHAKHDKHHDKGQAEHQDKGNSEHPKKGHGEHQDKGHDEHPDKGHGELKDKGHGEHQDKGHGGLQDKGHVEHQDKEHVEHQDKGHGGYQGVEHGEHQDIEHGELQDKGHGEHQTRGRGNHQARGRGDRQARGGRGERQGRGRGDHQVRGRGDRHARGRGDRQDKGRGERQEKGRSDNRGRFGGRARIRRDRAKDGILNSESDKEVTRTNCEDNILVAETRPHTKSNQPEIASESPVNNSLENYKAHEIPEEVDQYVVFNHEIFSYQDDAQVTCIDEDAFNMTQHIATSGSFAELQENIFSLDLLNMNGTNNTEHALNIPTDESRLLLPVVPEEVNIETNHGKMGIPIILSRHTHPPQVHESSKSNLDVNSTNEKANADASNSKIENESIQPNSNKNNAKVLKTKKARPKKSKEKEMNSEDVEKVAEEEIAVKVSVVEALEQLPAQKVVITAKTQVRMLRTASSNSLENKSDGHLTKSAETRTKCKPTRTNLKSLSTDEIVNQKAARRFNNDVRMCVEQSDPDTMRAILHDRRNHKFALDATVLEIVMKAYVMAAMLDDALYCLRVCTIPGTLTIAQTERILQCLPQNLRSSNAYAAADMINALCIATAFDSPTVRTYFLRIVRGIALEFLEEATSARDRICSASCERLVRSAVCIVDARLKKGKKPSELIVLPGSQLGVFVSDAMENRGIQAGDAVSILPYAGPYPMSAESLDRNMIEATVVNTNPTVVRLQDKANVTLHAMLTEDIEGNVYRIDKLANRMGFNRQLSAAVSFCSPIDDNPNGGRDTRRPCPQLIKAVTAMDENINKVMRQNTSSSIHNGVLTSTAALCAEAIPWNVDDERDDIDQESIRTISRLALEKYGAFENLNTSQQLAVEGATTRRLTLVQGPPGTGKTMTALRILQHWARLADAERKPGSEASPILATSDSNIAVDNLVEGCAAVGLRVVRLGRPEAIRPELLRFCIDRPPPAYGNNNVEGTSSSYASTGTTYKERMKQLKSAQVVCCTCIGSGSDILDSLGPLERVLVDEATQATEPAILVPLMRGCRQLVLVGDHCQLPPTVLSTRAEEEGHGVPLFSRMVACGVPPFMLDTQYRMHPGIAMFPSDLFYGGLLKNGVSAPERRPVAGFPWPREEFPVAFIPVKGIEMDDGVSKYNEEEAEAACKAVSFLLQGGQCSISDIAVVTPYAAQARLIRRMTRRMFNATGPPYIEVSSVDGFQGREKEAVVFSAVRSNDYGAIGFTSDWRRINVSFTRARRGLIVIGNDQTLRRGDPETWTPWLAWAEAHGLNVENPGNPRGRYDPEQLRRVRGGTTAAEMLKDVLARQQAQKKTAEQDQQRAVKNAAGHIIGRDDDDELKVCGGENNLSKLEQNVILVENTDGNWDDSDDEDTMGTKVRQLSHSVSRTTLASGSSSVGHRVDELNDVAVDAWDL